MKGRDFENLSRRSAMAGFAGIFLVPLSAAAESTGADDQIEKALRSIANGAEIRSGRVALMLPELAENGNTVSLLVNVDSPMTEADHVRIIHIISEKNPVANVVRFHLGPRAGRAKVGTNIRLATSQVVTAVAEMSDGSFWSGKAEVIVTLAACIDGG